MHISVLRGRGREQAAITDLIGRTAAGAGGALLVHGDLGLGKSALLAFAAVSGYGFTVLTTGGLDEEADLPGAALSHLLPPILEHAPALPEHQRRVLDRVLDGDGCPGTDRLPLGMAVLGLLGGAGRARPVLCCVDDAHLLDPVSLDAIGFAARRLGRRPVAMILASGADDGFPWVPRLRLAGLDLAGSRALLADLLPEAPTDRTVAALAGLAGGNPQALTDLAGCLSPAQCRGEAPPPTRLPADSPLRQAYRACLGSLPADTRWLLLLAAADEEMDATGLIQAALASGTDIAALAPAEARGLVHVATGAVTFRQPLLRSMAYEEAPLAQRRAAHLQLAATLDPCRQRLRHAMHLAAVAHGPDPRLADDLEAATPGAGYGSVSVALERAARLTTEPARAAVRLVTAAWYAWMSGDPHRARTLLLGVRRWFPGDPAPDGPPTPGQAVTEREVAGRRELLLGEIELRSGSTATALESLLTAADLLAGDQRGLAVHALLRAGEAVCFSGDHARYADLATRAAGLRADGEPSAVALMLDYIAGSAATFLGRHAEAARPLRRVVSLAGQLDDAAALTAASAASLLLADSAGAHRFAERALARARSNGDASRTPLAQQLLGFAQMWLTQYRAAEATCRDGLAAARASGQHNCAAEHLAMLAVLAAIHGDRSTCRRLIQELAVPATAGPVSRPKALSQWALAVLDITAGRYAEAVARLTSVADPATGQGQGAILVMATPWLVEAAARGTGRARATAALGAFDRWAGSTGDPARLALSARCHALLAPRGSAAAEEQFRRALDLHGDGAADFEWARTELLFGQELRRCRRPRDAREHLHRAGEMFEELAVPSWVTRARAELRAAGEAIEAGTAPVVALTAQQMQIAHLVAEGATNREVAAKLFISPRTVDHHMRNIFNRLGVRSRVELVRALS